MRKGLCAVLVFTLVFAVFSCGKKESRHLSEKEAEAFVMEQMQEDGDRNPEIVTLTEIEGTWYALLCLEEGKDFVFTDGYIEEKDGDYVWTEYPEVLAYYGKEKSFSISGWSRDGFGKTIFVRVDDEDITTEHENWHDGLRKIGDIDVHYSIEWD